MIGQGDGPVLGHVLFGVVVGISPNGVDVSLLLNVVEEAVDSLVVPGKGLHLDGDEVLAIFHRAFAYRADGGCLGLGMGPCSLAEESYTRGTKLKKSPTI